MADPDTTYDDNDLAKGVGGGDTILPDLKLPSAADIPTVPLARLPGGSSSSSDSDEPKTFGEAFRKAYAKGAGTEFTWNGQKKVALKAGDKGADKLASKPKPRATGAPPQLVKSTAPPSRTASSQTKSTSAPTPVAKKTDKTPAPVSAPPLAPASTPAARQAVTKSLTASDQRAANSSLSPLAAQQKAMATAAQYERDRVARNRVVGETAAARSAKNVADMKSQGERNAAAYRAAQAVKAEAAKAAAAKQAATRGMAPLARSSFEDRIAKGQPLKTGIKLAKGGGVEVRGKTKAKCYAKGGSIDGCAKRGHTKAGRR